MMEAASGNGYNPFRGSPVMMMMMSSSSSQDEKTGF